eukprot:66538-Chlamydomonas_euryale.AAC.1
MYDFGDGDAAAAAASAAVWCVQQQKTEIGGDGHRGYWPAAESEAEWQAGGAAGEEAGGERKAGGEVGIDLTTRHQILSDHHQIL